MLRPSPDHTKASRSPTGPSETKVWGDGRAQAGKASAWGPQYLYSTRVLLASFPFYKIQRLIGSFFFFFFPRRTLKKIKCQTDSNM